MAGIAQELEQALALHRQGKLAEAEALYRKIIALAPNHADALYFFGMLEFQRGRHDAAVPLFERAVAHNDGNPFAYFHLGCALQELKRTDAAIAAYDRTIALKPDLAEAYNNRANALRDAGRVDEARASFDCAIALKPDFLVALYNRGSVLRDLGRFDEALASLDRAVELKPDFAEAWHNRAAVLNAMKRSDEALESYDRALALKPGSAETLNNRGVVLADLGRFDAALESYDRALGLKPDYVEALNNRGNALRKLGRPDEALDCYARALVLQPDHADAFNNSGNALRDLGRHAEALARYDTAIALKPDYAEAYDNRGVVLDDLRRFDEALASFDRAIAIAPDYPDAYANKSLVKLRLGDFAEGWPLYEWRWRSKNFTSNPRNFRQPLWQGQALGSAQTILLHAEQGLGDTIEFCRYAPLVAVRGGRVVLEVQRPLMGLLRGLAGVDTMVAAGDALPDFDVHCPLLSLPGIIGTIPASVPYLAADPARIAQWRERLPQADFRIGIVWQGNPAVKIDRGRSAPLAAFAPLARVPGVRLISLQKHHGLDQLDHLPADMNIETLGDDFDAGADAFLDTAAIMMSLDLLVTTDTSIVHLAGALNRPIWVALQALPYWTWMLDREDSPWYPSMRLFRQTQAGDWTGVFERITRELVRLRR